MKKTTSIFTVSLVAILVAGGANGAITSKNYVDSIVSARATNERVATVENDIADLQTAKADKATTLSGYGITDGATTTALTNGLAAKENTANKVKTIRAAATATDTAYPSEKAVATALAGKQASGDYATNTALNAVKTTADSAVQPGDLATVATTGSYNDLANKPTIPAAITVDSALSATSTNPVQNKVINTALAGKQASLGYTAENTANKTTTIAAAASASDTKYPSEKAVATALAGKQAAGSYATTAAVNAKVSTAQGTANAGKGLVVNTTGNLELQDIATQAELDTVSTTASNAATAAANAASAASAAQATANKAVVANAAITAGTATKITYDAKGLVTKGESLAAGDIPTIPSSKVSGLATVATSGSYNDLTNKPTIPAAVTVDDELSPTSTNPVQNKVINSALGGKLSTSGTAAQATADASGNVITTTYATKAQITALNSTSTGTGAVVTGVSQTGGKVSVTKGNVQIPVGSATGTTYATIWVE